MHAVIQRYRVRLGTMEQAARYAEKWFLPLVRAIPGLVSYSLVGAEDGVLVAVGMFETAAAASAAARVAGEWFHGEWSAFRQLPPEVVTGEVVAQTVVAGRVPSDRRHLVDRRRATMLTNGEPDRRTGVERRHARRLQAVL